jgi:hypothetical protein
LWLQAHGWSAGIDQPLLFFMHCNPTHYLFMHEGGHRLSFDHAETWVTRSGFTGSADPRGSGFPSSTLPTNAKVYSDETDMMACCHGDYSVWARVQSGFIRGSAERKILWREDLDNANTQTVELCPFDRAECRGSLMAVSFQTQDNGTVLFGWRSVPFWQDLPFTAGTLDTRRSRENVAGLSVVYGQHRGPQQPIRTLLDFNTLFSTFPDALPKAALVSYQ